MIDIYSTPVCPYCDRAKELLKAKGVAFREFNMHDLSADERAALSQKTGAYRTVPQIFIHDTFIGGFDQLNQLNQQGKLDEMLNKG